MGRTASKKTAAKKDSDWFRKDDDVRWVFGVPPKDNANFAWVQHFIHHLAPQTALRDSALLQREASPQVLSAAKNNMVALPGRLFYSTQIPVCLWFIGKKEAAGKCRAVCELELALAA